jgi:serine protease Do
MPVELSCPGCKLRFRFSRKELKPEVTCPGCGKTIRVNIGPVEAVPSPSPPRPPSPPSLPLRAIPIAEVRRSSGGMRANVPWIIAGVSVCLATGIGAMAWLKPPTEKQADGSVPAVDQGAALPPTATVGTSNSSSAATAPKRVLTKIAGPSPAVNSASPISTATPIPMTAEEVYAKCSASVVTVRCKNRQGKVIGLGSGFIVDPKSSGFDDERLAILEGYRLFRDGMQMGVVVTNFHVIDAAVEAEVEFSNGKVLEVDSIECEDPKKDLAALILMRDRSEAFPAIPISTEAPSVGATVFAIGSPQGLKATLSAGNVSARREMDGCAVVQTTAPISPGSSGGPLLDSYGRVVGVVRFLVGGQNLNFAIAASEIKPFLSTKHEPRRVFRGRDASREWGSDFNGALLAYLATLKGAKPSGDFESAYRDLKRLWDETDSTTSTPQQRLARLRGLRSRLAGHFEPWICYLEGFLNYKIVWSEFERRLKRMPPSAEYAEAVRCYETGLRSKPDADYLRFKLCELYSLPLSEDGPKLMAEASELVRRRPYDAEAHRLLGLGYELVSQHSRSVEEYLAATKLDPASHQLWDRLGSAQVRVRDTEGAIASFERYRDCGGDAWMANYNFGWAHEKAEQYEKAISFYTTARDGGPEPFKDACNEGIVRCRAALMR